jgi:hypothetical protein
MNNQIKPTMGPNIKPQKLIAIKNKVIPARIHHKVATKV